MDYKTFKSLELEKQVELYNEWLIVNHLDEYILYPNDKNINIKRHIISQTKVIAYSICLNKLKEEV